MREILTIQLGQCGNAVGTQFWEVLCLDHCLNPAGAYVGQNEIQLQRINVFFSEARGLRYTPRSVMIDLDKASLEAVRSSPMGRIFKEDNFIYGSGGTGNNWAKGHFTEGVQICDESLDIIRREVEACDCFHGFQLIHSIGGGTGGGLGSLLLGKVREEYPTRVICTYSVIPSPRVSNATVEPYNAVLTMSHLIESAEETICIDNEALFYIMTDLLKLNQVVYCDLNYLIALAMTGITASMRFPGSANTSLKKLAVNLIPFPRMHFLVPSYAPLVSKASRMHRDFSVSDIISQVFDAKRMFATFDPKNGAFLTVACLFRGEVSLKDVDIHMQNIRNKNSAHFVEWIPDSVKTAVCYYPFPVVRRSATFLSNTTGIKDVMNRIKDQYLAMFRRKAFLHWYTGEGMEEKEFEAAESNIQDLVSEYKEQDDHRGDKTKPRLKGSTSGKDTGEDAEEGEGKEDKEDNEGKEEKEEKPEKKEPEKKVERKDKPREKKDVKETKDPRDPKDPKDPKDLKDTKDAKDAKDPKDPKNPKDPKEPKEPAERKPAKKE